MSNVDPRYAPSILKVKSTEFRRIAAQRLIDDFAELLRRLLGARLKSRAIELDANFNSSVEWKPGTEPTVGFGSRPIKDVE